MYQKEIQYLNMVLDPVISKLCNTNLGSSDEEFLNKFIFFHILERTNNNLKSLKLLFHDYKPYHEQSIGLICRNMLTDFINLCFIIDSDVENIEDSEVHISSIYQNIACVLNDDIEKFKNKIEKLKSLGILDESEARNHLNYPPNSFKSAIKKLKHLKPEKRYPGTTKFVEILNNKKFPPKYLEYVNGSFKDWVYLSKYEHIGWMSYEISRIAPASSTFPRYYIIACELSILTLPFLGFKHEAKVIHQHVSEYLKS